MKRHTTWPIRDLSLMPRGQPGAWPLIGPGPYGWECSCGDRCRGYRTMAGAASGAQNHMTGSAS